MATQGTISHDQFPADICTPHEYMAENVGMATGDPIAAVAEINTLMMNEGPCPQKGCPGMEIEQHGHYVNLMSAQYTRIGIGVYVASNGSVWLTEDFTDGKSAPIAKG